MGNWYEERLYPEQPFREKQEKKVLHFFYLRFVTKMKELPVSTIQDSKGNSLDYKEEINGKPLAESFSMMV